MQNLLLAETSAFKIVDVTTMYSPWVGQELAGEASAGMHNQEVNQEVNFALGNQFSLV